MACLRLLKSCITHWGSWSLFWATKTAHKCSIADISIKPIKETSTTCSLLVCNTFMTLGHEKQFQDESLASHFFDIYVEREKKRKSSTRHIHVPPESLYFIFRSFHIWSCFNVILGTENGRNIITNISICYLTVKTTTTKPAGKMREKMRADTKLLHQQEKLYNGSLDGEWRTTLLIISSH